MKEKILIVDDQVSFCNHIEAALDMEGYQAVVAHNAKQAIAQLTSQPFDILLTDMKMPGMEGLELFKTARKIDPEISGIIMTAYGSISSAVAAIKHGASDYLQKPFEPETLLMVIEKTARERQILQEIRHLRKEVNKKYAFGSIIGKNYKMQAIYALIKKVSGTDARVFITGETGGGKSTLIGLILGLLEPQFGSIRVNGADIFGRQRPGQLALVRAGSRPVTRAVFRLCARAVPQLERTDLLGDELGRLPGNGRDVGIG